jgi:membrane protein DedA with SNARE-associated domain
MWEEILKAITLVYLPSMVKFIFGPLAGYGAKLNILTTIIATVSGTMTIVLLFSFAGDWIRNHVINRFFPKRKRFSERNRKFVTIWKKYGVAGVAFLTPLLLTPIGGTLLAVSFGSPREKLILYMLLSASVWATIFSLTIYLFGNNVFPDYMK